MSYQLSVDLGTTFTAAAVANGMPPTMMGLGNRALQIPSVLFLAEDGTMLVGEAAQRRGMAQPDRVVREFKRRIGDSVPILVAGTPFSPQALTSRLLEHVLAAAGERMGESPQEVVLTHPANWGPYKLDLLDQAARLAGVERWARCPEPLAAAAQYAAKTRVVAGDTIAIYDLGGGTFDACVLEKTTTGFALLGTPEGIEHLGGIDFDEALFQHVVALLGDRMNVIDPDDPDVIVGLTRLHRDCIEAKEALSGDTEVLLPVALPGISTTLRLTRGEFESLIRPALRDTITTLTRAIRSTGRTADQLRAIVLVGGSSRIPLIGELLHRTFATTTAMDTHPKHDIALGAVQVHRNETVSAATDVPHTPNGRKPGTAARHARASKLKGSTSPLHPSTVRSNDNAAITPSAARKPRPASASSSLSPVPQGTDRAPIRGGAPARTVPKPTPNVASRHRLTILGVATVAVIASIIIGIAVFKSRGAASDSSASEPTPTEGFPHSAPLAPSQILVQMETGNQWDIWLGDINSPSPVRRLTTGQGFNGWPVISPSFDSVIYIHANDNNNMDPRPEVRRRSHSTLRVAGAAFLEGDRELFALPKGCSRASRVAWDPVDSSRLAVGCFDTDNRYHVWLMEADGTLIRVVNPPSGRPRMGDVTFSSDGRLLAFWASADAAWDGGVLYTVPVNGGTPQPLIKNDSSSMKGRDADPAFSPDGRYVAFRRREAASNARGQFDIFRVDVNGTGLNRLTDDPADEEDPNWSRDSKQIAYKSAATTDVWPGPPIPRVWIMGLDGGDKHLLWTNGSVGQQFLLAWTPR